MLFVGLLVCGLCFWPHVILKDATSDRHTTHRINASLRPAVRRFTAASLHAGSSFHHTVDGVAVGAVRKINRDGVRAIDRDCHLKLSRLPVVDTRSNAADTCERWTLQAISKALDALELLFSLGAEQWWCLRCRQRPESIVAFLLK